MKNFFSFLFQKTSKCHSWSATSRGQQTLFTTFTLDSMPRLAISLECPWPGNRFSAAQTFPRKTRPKTHRSNWLSFYVLVQALSFWYCLFAFFSVGCLGSPGILRRAAGGKKQSCAQPCARTARHHGGPQSSPSHATAGSYQGRSPSSKFSLIFYFILFFSHFITNIIIPSPRPLPPRLPLSHRWQSLPLFLGLTSFPGLITLLEIPHLRRFLSFQFIWLLGSSRTNFWFPLFLSMPRNHPSQPHKSFPLYHRKWWRLSRNRRRRESSTGRALTLWRDCVSHFLLDLESFPPQIHLSSCY